MRIFFVRSDPLLHSFVQICWGNYVSLFFPRQAQLTYFDLLSIEQRCSSCLAIRWLCYSTWIPWLWTMIMVEECERSGMVWWWLFPVHSALKCAKKVWLMEVTQFASMAKINVFLKNFWMELSWSGVMKKFQKTSILAFEVIVQPPKLSFEIGFFFTLQLIVFCSVFTVFCTDGQ